MWRCVGAREAEGCAIAREEITEGGGEEFTPVIALHALYGDVELGEDIRVESVYHVDGVGFVA